MSLPRFSVRNHVLVNMLMVVILVGGLMLALTLVREMFPESRPTKLTITAVYPGVQPQEIEKAVTIKIEEAVHDIEGIEKVDSLVAESLTMISLTLFNDVKDVDAVLQEVKTEVDAVQNIPEGVEEITVKKFEPNLPVISVAIFGEGDEAGLKRAARELRDELLTLPGISRVDLNGARDDEISVDVKPDQLLKYDVTFDEIAEAIAATNIDVSGGQLKGSRNTVSLRTLGEELEGRELENIVVKSRPGGEVVLLSDVAEVRDTFVDSDLEGLFNGVPSMDCVVYKTKTQDAIQIAQLVRAYVAGKQDVEFDPYGFSEAYDSPWYYRPFSLISCWVSQGVTKLAGRPDPMVYYERSRAEPFEHPFELELHTNIARFVEGRLDLMTRNGRAGLVLVLLSLYLFLNWRIAFWAATGLCIAFLGTFIVMYLFGSTINLLSMFGLIIVLGIIVDDAIVIGENIYRHVEEGMPAKEAAVVGAEEVMWPVIIAVATTIAAFMPMFFIKGQIGDFMKELPIVVLAALSVSLVEALVILPAHLSHLPKPKKRTETADDVQTFRGRMAHRMNVLQHLQNYFVQDILIKNYERFLRFAIRWRYPTLACSIAIMMLAIGLVAADIVKFTFIQKMDSETIICGLEMPVGTSSENVKNRLEELGQFITTQEEVVNAQMFVARQIDLGGGGALGNDDQSHLGQIIIELLPADERDDQSMRSSEELLSHFRKFAETLNGVNAVTWEAMSGGPGGKDIEIRLSGRDFDQLQQASEELKWMLGGSPAGAELQFEGYAGVFDIDDNFDDGKREIQLRLRDSAEPTGIRLMTLGQQIRSAMYGREARRITRDREDVKIMVRFPEDYREDRYSLETMWIPGPLNPADGSRNWIPLREIAEVTESESYTTIHRSDLQRSLTIYGEIDQAVTSTSEVLPDVEKKFDELIAPRYPGVTIEFLGKMQEMNKSFASLKLAFPVALLLIYTMLAGLFRSYAQPLVVMSAIPFGLLGAIVGHWVTDNPITILSMIGMLALTGILVNDSLVLVDFINTRIRSGMSEFEATIQGAKLRLRAILLTTLTTVSGLLPIMFERSFQAKFLIPMAVTLTFGLIFATALTLLVVPTINMIFFDLRNLMKKISGKEEEVTVEEKTPVSTGV